MKTLEAMFAEIRRQGTKHMITVGQRGDRQSFFFEGRINLDAPAEAVDAVHVDHTRRLEAAIIQISDSWAMCEGDPREKDVIEVHLKDTDGSVVTVLRPREVGSEAPVIKAVPMVKTTTSA